MLILTALITLSLFTPLKRETEKALKTASRSVATDYFHFSRSVTKNDKLTTFKQCRFLNAPSLLTFNSAGVLKKEKAVTHLSM